LLSRIAKQLNFLFAIQDSKTIKYLLSWIATLFAIQDSKKNKNLLSRIGKQIAIFAILDSKTFAIQDSKTIQTFCCPG
jgi:hypothetical protein